MIHDDFFLTRSFNHNYIYHKDKLYYETSLVYHVLAAFMISGDLLFLLVRVVLWFEGFGLVYFAPTTVKFPTFSGPHTYHSYSLTQHHCIINKVDFRDQLSSSKSFSYILRMVYPFILVMYLVLIIGRDFYVFSFQLFEVVINGSWGSMFVFKSFS